VFVGHTYLIRKEPRLNLGARNASLLHIVKSIEPIG
jgi:hypothetical protein